MKKTVQLRIFCEITRNQIKAFKRAGHVTRVGNEINT